MGDLSPEVEQQIAAMSQTEFDALTARVRAPDVREAYRDIARNFVPESALDDWVDSINISKFTNTDGTLDEGRVRDRLGVMFPGQQQFGSGVPQHTAWGQNSGLANGINGAVVPGSQPSAAEEGRQAAEERFGVEAHRPPERTGRAEAGLVEARRRFGDQSGHRTGAAQTNGGITTNAQGE